MNITVAFICYLINYGSIKTGLAIDWIIIKATFAKDYTALVHIFTVLNPNLLVLVIGLINLFSISNLIPILPLDGGFIWAVLLRDKLGNNYEKIIKRISKIGYLLLFALQFFIIWYYIL